MSRSWCSDTRSTRCADTTPRPALTWPDRTLPSAEHAAAHPAPPASAAASPNPAALAHARNGRIRRTDVGRVNTNITATAPPQGVPGDLIDLTRWYLTLPIKDPTGKDTSGPWDVYQPDLRNFSCEYFRVSPVKSVPVVEYI